MGRIVGLQINTAEKAELFVCPECGKEYKTKDGLEKHVTEKHPQVHDEEQVEE